MSVSGYKFWAHRNAFSPTRKDLLQLPLDSLGNCRGKEVTDLAGQEAEERFEPPSGPLPGLLDLQMAALFCSRPSEGEGAQDQPRSRGC